MNDQIQHLKRFFKTDIFKYRKLLTAAVVLFSAFWAVVSPIKGVEALLILNAKEAESVGYMQASQNVFANSGVYLTANSLACITADSEEGEVPVSNDSSLVVVQKSALLVQSNPITFVSQNPRDEITTYVVQQDDTPISIAAAHGITTNSLLWANNLTAYSIIRPGDELTIPPVSGVIHRVKNGDTVSSIANYYDAESEDIIAFNDLPANGSISIGQKLIVPDGQLPAAKPQRVTYATVSGAGTGVSRAFPWGQCTWYVAQKRVVTWSGHAKSWLANAAAYGYQTGSTPQAGAIMVLTEGGWMGRLYGHVAYVESVKNGWVTISEMNYRCLGCKSIRTLNIHDKRIRGYIY
jgi:surface antigen